MIRTLLPIVTILAFFASSSITVAQIPNNGEQSPVQTIPNLIKSSVDKEELELSDLGGRVVVLEFWATWCSPCVSSLQHLQDVAAEFDEDRAVVIAIAVEEQARVKRFLERNKYPALWFACDEERSVFEKFGLVGIPNTVILDGNGKIAAITTPDEVTKELLQRISEGKPANVKAKAQRGIDIDWSPSLDSDGSEVFANLVIADADPEAHGGGSKMVPGSGRISGDGLARTNLLQIAFNTRNTRMIDGFGNFKPGEPTYKVSVLAPGGNDQLAREMLAAALRVKFGFQERREAKTVEVFFLRRTEGEGVSEWEKSTVKPDQESFRANGGGIELVGKPISKAAEWFENITGKPVIDETGLKDRYDLKLEWVDGPSFTAELERVGLRLEKGTAPLEFLIIEPINALSGDNN